MRIRYNRTIIDFYYKISYMEDYKFFMQQYVDLFEGKEELENRMSRKYWKISEMVFYHQEGINRGFDSERLAKQREIIKTEIREYNDMYNNMKSMVEDIKCVGKLVACANKNPKRVVFMIPGSPKFQKIKDSIK